MRLVLCRKSVNAEFEACLSKGSVFKQPTFKFQMEPSEDKPVSLGVTHLSH